MLHYLGEDVVLQFGGGAIGHPMGIAAGATATRVALEGCQGPHRGPGLPQEGQDILKQVAKKSPELQAALDTWGEVEFNYESTDTPDLAETPTAA
ncbi:MAG TPA: RuBisCO large subunit C-terminal-like domain-containing protein [Acidimicrobiales bacterium]|nr:RuBisCO large subunit C-terminal-like domain-containing protein [Acidimicrobiales bacterium]